VVDLGFSEVGFRFRQITAKARILISWQVGATEALQAKYILEALYVYAEDVKQSIINPNCGKCLEFRTSVTASDGFSTSYSHHWSTGCGSDRPVPLPLILYVSLCLSISVLLCLLLLKSSHGRADSFLLLLMACQTYYNLTTRNANN